MWKRLWHQEEGQALVMAALLMSVLLGFAALVVDVGYLYTEKRQLQTAVDAAALAGALIGAETTDEGARGIEIAKYLKANLNVLGESMEQVKVDFTDLGEQNVEVSVYARDDYQTFFARVLGIQSADISAKAKAKSFKATFDPFGFSVFSENAMIDFNGNKSIIDGDVYAAGGFKFNSDMTITGDVATTSNQTLTTGERDNIEGDYVPDSEPIAMVDYSMLLEYPAEVMTEAEFNEKYITGTNVLDGIVKVIFEDSATDKTLEIGQNSSGNQFVTGAGVIYTNGNMKISVTNPNTTSILYYSDKEVTITSSAIYGTVYAPNGTITLNGDPQVPVTGRLLAQGQVDLNGAKLNLQSPVSIDDWMKSLKPISKLIE